MHFLGRQPCDTSWLNWGNHSAEGFSLYFSVDPWAWWEQQRYNTLEGVISCSGRGQLGTVPDSRPTPHVSVHLNQTADPEQPQSLTRWQRRWSVVESLPRVAIYLTNTAHTPKGTILQQPWSVPAGCQSREGGTMLIDFSFFSGVKIRSFILWLWMLGLDLLIYPALVHESEVSCRKGTMWYLETVKFYTFGVHSAASQIAF